MTRHHRFAWLFVASALLATTGLQVPQSAADEKTKLVFSTYWPESYAYLIEPIRTFAKCVATDTDGQVEIEIFHSGQLFSGSEEFSAVQRGDVDMSAPLDLYHTGAMPLLGVTTLPFLWPSPESLQKTLDAGLWDKGLKQKLLDEYNMVVLDVAAGDPYQIYSQGFAVHGPDDMKGKKWAVSGTTASKAVALMGGAPTTMGSGELYLALQRGMIDGTTRPLLTGIGRRLYEVVDHLAMTNMSYFTTFLIINKDSWESLTPDAQEVLTKCGDVRSDNQLKRLEKFLASSKAKFAEHGVEVYEPTEEEMAAFREKMAPVYDWWKKKVEGGEALIEFAREHQ